MLFLRLRPSKRWAVRGIMFSSCPSVCVYVYYDYALRRGRQFSSTLGRISLPPIPFSFCKFLTTFSHSFAIQLRVLLPWRVLSTVGPSLQRIFIFSARETIDRSCLQRFSATENIWSRTFDRSNSITWSMDDACLRSGRVRTHARVGWKSTFVSAYG